MHKLRAVLPLFQSREPVSKSEKLPEAELSLQQRYIMRVKKADDFSAVWSESHCLCGLLKLRIEKVIFQE